MYDRQVDGRVLEFGVSGKLISNILVMYDRETESYWPQIIGEAIKGPLTGTELVIVPHLQMNWKAWVKQFPDSQILSKELGFGPAAYSIDRYNSYYRSSNLGVVPNRLRSELLPQKELVTGVTVEGRPKAYSDSGMAEHKVFNDVLADKPLVVTYSAEAESGQVFSSMVDGMALTFEFLEIRNGIVYMTDQETGSIWNGATGVGVEGAHAGKKLEPIPFSRSFWFGWFNFFPDTDVL